MRLRLVVALVVSLTSSVALAGPPIHDPRVIQPVGDVITGPHGQDIRDKLADALGSDATQGTILDAGACTPESIFETHPSKRPNGGGMYGPDACRRLRLVFGPILMKPGQDDVLIQPVTVEKPLYDGYMVRFKPSMVDQLGSSPPVEEAHLHHGTWLNAYPQTYGRGNIWIASGEEKTIVPWPYRYGMKVGGTDTWLFLHMVHNATARPQQVYVTYDIDFIPTAKAEAIQPDGKPLLTNTKGMWLDAGGSKFHPETETYTLNPIFNIQKGYGAPSTDSLGRPVNICRFPDDNCASFNSSGNVSAQQGKDVSGEVSGWTYEIRSDLTGPTGKGTIIMMGGHTHNGGLRTEIELVRGNEARVINISEAYYWQKAPYTDRIGAPPVSWDYSQTGMTLDIGWAVDVQVGDRLRLNGVYETDIASWYEQMGIVMSWIVPGGIAEGVDPFAPGVTVDPRIPVTAAVPKGADGTPLPQPCVPSETNLCTRGQVSHGQISTSGNHGTNYGCTGQACDFDWSTVADGVHLTEVPIGGFTYGAMEHAVARAAGVPTVDLGETLTFYNADTADYMWHSVTRCAAPCTGNTTVDYPIADGGIGIKNDVMDFDSTMLGVGLGAANKVEWSLTPDRTGTFTFFCRIHPSMRGVFRVK